MGGGRTFQKWEECILEGIRVELATTLVGCDSRVRVTVGGWVALPLGTEGRRLAHVAVALGACDGVTLRLGWNEYVDIRGIDVVILSTFMERMDNAVAARVRHLKGVGSVGEQNYNVVTVHVVEVGGRWRTSGLRGRIILGPQRWGPVGTGNFDHVRRLVGYEE